eukprot:3217739-Karenia_brevis.AAC.1
MGAVKPSLPKEMHQEKELDLGSISQKWFRIRPKQYLRARALILMQASIHWIHKTMEPKEWMEGR